MIVQELLRLFKGREAVERPQTSSSGVQLDLRENEEEEFVLKEEKEGKKKNLSRYLHKFQQKLLCKISVSLVTTFHVTKSSTCTAFREENVTVLTAGVRNRCDHYSAVILFHRELVGTG